MKAFQIALFLCFFFGVTLGQALLQTPVSLFVWNSSSPSFRMYPKNEYGYVQTDQWTDVTYQSFTTGTLVCLLQTGSTDLGTNWEITPLATTNPNVTGGLVFTKVLNGATVIFTFQAYQSTSSVAAYNNSLTFSVNPSLKMNIQIINWNFPASSDCFHLNFAITTSQTILSILPAVTGLLNLLTIVTSGYTVLINNLNVASSGSTLLGLGDILISFLTNVVLLVGTLGGSLSYSFPLVPYLEYDPDYTIVTNIQPSCPLLSNCNSHGTCVNTNVCKCNTGWGGSDCSQVNCPGTPQCSNHGTCTAVGANNYCQCNTGWLGQDCSVANCPGGGSIQCNGNGQCITDATTPYCNCNYGWTGSSCGIPQCPGTPTDCSGHGTCNGTVSPPTCMCNANWGGSDCSVGICPGTPSCSGHGSCDTMVNPPACYCNVGWGTDNCSQVFLCSNDSQCNHGRCNATDGQCVCSSDWRGTDCLIPVCPGFNSSTGNCNGMGYCNATTSPHYCICPDGWIGESCEIAICPGNNCSGNGNCIVTATPPTCSCQYGWTGNNCSTPLPSAVNYVATSSSPSQSLPIVYIAIFTTVGVVVAVIIAVVGIEIYRRRVRLIEERIFSKASEMYRGQSSQVFTPHSSMSPSGSSLSIPPQNRKSQDVNLKLVI